MAERPDETPGKPATGNGGAGKGAGEAEDTRRMLRASAGLPEGENAKREEPRRMELIGKEVTTGLAKVVELTSDEVCAALDDPRRVLN